MPDAKITRPLDTYNRKRDFTETPEPEGKISSKSGNSFVIQKHAARTLHFDLRLEINGVFVSWAVVKGPSLDPSIRRLAVRTEDHPMSYGSFQGEIPPSHYGAGRVEIWDHGTYAIKNGRSPIDALNSGHLKFNLCGQRLRGGFALVRTKPDLKTGHALAEQWLLIKEKDAAATTAFDPTETWIGSVDDPDGEPTPAPSVPQFMPPQLATEADRAPTGADWIHEIKYDGYRIQAVKSAEHTRLFTRSGLDWSSKLPAISQAIAKLSREQLVLDGELVAFDEHGNSDFSALQSAMKSNARDTHYVVFDVLQIDRRDLKNRPWKVRNGELRALLANVKAPLKLADHVEGSGAQVFDAAVKLGAEGIVSKHIERPWKSGRNRHWLKVKGEKRGVFAIGGYRKSKSRAFASLLLGELEGSRLIYRGRVGTGFSDQQLADLSQAMQKLNSDAMPFVSVPDDVAKDAIWTVPTLFAEIAYGDVTAEAHLRHAKFVRLSDPLPRRKPNIASTIKLTNAERVIYPELGLTKGDLYDYYDAVSDRMILHLQDRFISLVRAPDGDLDKTFFQRHAFAGMPDSFEVAGKDRYISISGREGLLAAAQFSVLEFHPWGAKRSALDRPDRLVLDLDPDETLPFKVVREAARLVRDVLAAGGLRTFPLLTGGKGVHVIAPLDETSDWAAVSHFAKSIARHLARAAPDRFVATATKSKRKGRIYVDWQRNRKSATAIAPWSPRARPGAAVACPVTWDELADTETAAIYNLSRALHRLASLRTDPWDGFWEIRQTVPADFQ